MVCAGVWARRIPGATFVPSAWIKLSSKSQSRKGPQASLSYWTLRTGAWASKSTSLPRYLTFLSSTPEAFAPWEADGLITRKLHSGLPSEAVVVAWNCPARPLGGGGRGAAGGRDGLITRKLHSGLPSEAVVLTWNCPARPLGVGVWLALGGPQVSAAASASAGGPAPNPGTARAVLSAAPPPPARG